MDLVDSDVSKQSDFALYRPSAVTLAAFLVDAPVILSGICVFSVITYFLGSLDIAADKFWTYFIFISINAITFNQLFKAIAALCSNFGSAIRFVIIQINRIFNDMIQILCLFTQHCFHIGWLHHSSLRHWLVV